MMKYTPLTRMEKKPITRAPSPAATAGATSAARSPGNFGSSSAAV